jgi:hypothetical protein
MAVIDLEGTYRGTILESAVALTKKGFPQTVLRLRAEEKWVSSPVDMAANGIEEPAWLDWSKFDESIVAYLVLFNNTEEFSADTELLNYTQLKLATGIKDGDFRQIANNGLAGKKILFRVSTNEYNGKVSLQVSWIDLFNANPTQQIRQLSDEDVAKLNAKFAFQAPAAPVKAAKSTVKPKKESPPISEEPQFKQEDIPF